MMLTTIATQFSLHALNYTAMVVNITGLAFFDLRKALDTKSYKTLREKLSNYGFRGVAYNLIQSYFPKQ